MITRRSMVFRILSTAVTLFGVSLLRPAPVAAAGRLPDRPLRAVVSIGATVVRHGGPLIPSPDSLRDTLAARFTRVEAQLPTLEALLAQCRQRGIPTAYEVVDYTTIKNFIPWGREDLAGHMADAAHIATAIEQLYQEATTHLQAYLAGTQQAVAAPQYVTQRPRIDGYSFLGDMRWPGGRIEHHRPIFFIGYGVSWQIRKDIPQFTDYGANILQVETGPAGVIFPRGAIDWRTAQEGAVHAHFTVDTTVAHTGRRSMLVTNATPYTPGAFASAGLPVYVERRMTYHVSLWVKGDHVSHAQLVLAGDTMDIHALDGGRYSIIAPSVVPNNPADIHPLPDGTYDWQKLEFQYTTGDNEFVRPFIVRTAGPTAHLWIDDIQMTAAGHRENLIPDPGFEAIPSVPPGQDFYASATQSQADIVKVLQNAARHNIAVDVLLSPHYWPDLPGSWDDLYNPEAKAILTAYIRTLIPLIKEYPSLNSICLSNEPSYWSEGQPADRPAWHAYLQHAYSDIQQLNAAYGTQYATFADVPDNPTGRGGQYDWKDFIDQTFADRHHWMADLVHQLAPDIPVHAKIQSYDMDPKGGIDPALFAPFSQITGLDSPGGDFWYLGFYDVLGPLKAMPIFNSEDHIIHYLLGSDPRGVRTQLWQGAIHGRNASVIWVWERRGGDDLLQEPAVVAEIGKTALDLNRLAREVTALHEAPAPVAIFRSSLAASEPVYNAKRRAYTALTRRGQHVDFITAQQIAAGKLRRYKLLVIPAGEPMPQPALAAVARFVDAGGGVATVDDAAGDSVLAWDDHGRPLPPDVRAHVLAKAVQVRRQPSGALASAPLQQQLDALGLTRVRLIDATTHQPVSADADNDSGRKNTYNDDNRGNPVGWEWRSVAYHGRLLVNLVAYADTDRAVSLEVDGQPIAQAKDLISGVMLVGPVFHVHGMTPYVFELPTEVRQR